MESNGHFSVVHKTVVCMGGNWIQGRCEKLRVTTRLAMWFSGSRCNATIKETLDSIKKLFNEVETVNKFCYLGD